MSLHVKFLSGQEAGQSLQFGDDIEQIQLGRDPERCQVVFPPEMTMVGREHCTITRSSGRYFLEMGPDRAVQLNGSLVEGGCVLPMQSELQIGPKGPKLSVTWEKNAGLAATTPQEINSEEIARRASRPVRETQLEAQANTSKRNVVGGMVVLLFIVAGVFLFLQTQVDDVVTEQVASVDRLEQKYAQLAADTGSDDLQSALQHASNSTYLVIYQKKDGSELGFGTAWVVAPGTLATNAHVAEKFNEIGSQARMLLRSASRGGDDPVNIRVEGIELHPGYGEFAELWHGYVPVRFNALKDMERVRSAGSGCDVALLTVAQADHVQLAPALKLAGPEVQALLTAGEPVGYVGYPMENMAVEGVNLQRPTPQMQFGRLTAITTDFNTSADEPSPGSLNTLLQHSLPATGGASGSPLINSQGEVVGILSAVNFAMLGDRRIPTGVGVNFAQRANLIDELLQDDDGTHAMRSSFWHDEIKQLYVSGKVEEKNVDLEALVAGWESQISVDFGDQHFIESKTVDHGFFNAGSLNAGSLVLVAGDTLGMEMFARELEIELAAKSEYLLAAEADGPLALEFESGNGVVIKEFMEIRPGLKAISISSEEAATLRGRILVSTEAKEMRYTVREAHAKPITAEIVLKQVKDEWLGGLELRDGATLEAVEVGHWNGSINAKHETLRVHAATQVLEIDESGPYLLTAISENNKPLDMRLLQTGMGNQTVIAEDDAADWYPCIAFDSNGSAKLKAELFAPEAGTSYRIWLFRTKPETK
jgi:V8-like Glu-specific endopeptidase